MLLYIIMVFGSVMGMLILFILHFGKVSFNSTGVRAKITSSPFLILFFIFCAAISVITLVI